MFLSLAVDAAFKCQLGLIQRGRFPTGQSCQGNVKKIAAVLDTLTKRFAFPAFASDVRLGLRRVGITDICFAFAVPLHMHGNRGKSIHMYQPRLRILTNAIRVIVADGNENLLERSLITVSVLSGNFLPTTTNASIRAERGHSHLGHGVQEKRCTILSHIYCPRDRVMSFCALCLSLAPRKSSL